MPESFNALKQDARQKMGAAKPNAVLVGLVFMLITSVISILVNSLTGYSNYMNSVYDMYADILQNGGEPYTVPYPQISAMGMALSGALLLMSLMVEYGFERYCLLTGRGEKAGFRDLFSGFDRPGRVFGLMALRALIIAAWTMLFVVPGVLAFYRYRTAVFVLEDHPEMGPVACLQETARQTRGRRMELFRLDLAFFWWWLGSYFVSYLVYLPVLDMWVKPYAWTTRALWYDRVNGRVPTSPDDGGINPAP